MAPPRADRPMASAAARPSHLSRSARAASIACAKAGLAVRTTAAATPRAKREAKDLEMRRMMIGLLLGLFSGADLSCKRAWFLVVCLVFFVGDGLTDVDGRKERKDHRLDDGDEHSHYQGGDGNQEGDDGEEGQHDR